MDNRNNIYEKDIQRSQNKQKLKEARMKKGTIYQNEAWRKETGMTLDPTGEPLEPVVKPKLKLVGTDGNAFSILGKAKNAARQAGWNKEKIGLFFFEATSGNCDHLIQTCMEYFDVE